MPNAQTKVQPLNLLKQAKHFASIDPNRLKRVLAIAKANSKR